jgi:RNA polymerase sigma factor (TIGR02999 family)
VVGDESHGVITALLHRHRAGDRAAYDELVSLVYERLRRIAHAQLARGWPSNTLTPTALVHEAYVQLLNETGVEWQDRSHFYAICARTMRRTLVDYARRRGALKRAGGARPLSLENVDPAVDPQLEVVLAIDEALTSLERFNVRLARIVECRCLAGLTEQETAGALGTSLRTVQREWVRARAWLLKELGAAAGRGEHA